MERLCESDELAREVLWSLPPEPDGVSAADLADSILGDRGSATVVRIEAALTVVAAEIPLYMRRGADTLEQADAPDPAQVWLFAVPAAQAGRVRRAGGLIDWSQAPGLPLASG